MHLQIVFAGKIFSTVGTPDPVFSCVVHGVMIKQFFLRKFYVTCFALVYFHFVCVFGSRFAVLWIVAALLGPIVLLCVFLVPPGGEGHAVVPPG